MGALTRVSLAVLLPMTAHAQDRRCDGRDPAAAERARTRATALLEANLGRSRVNVAALREAMREATAACDAGDPRGLLHRALAREALAETHLAARDLDAFLGRDPARAGDPFVRALRERLDPGVGRVRVTRAESLGARVQIDGAWLDGDGSCSPCRRESPACGSRPRASSPWSRRFVSPPGRSWPSRCGAMTSHRARPWSSCSGGLPWRRRATRDRAGA